MQIFMDSMSENLPDSAVYKSMGINGIIPGNVLEQLKANFKLK